MVLQEQNRLGVQYADLECPVFRGLSMPELLVAGGVCFSLSLLPAVLASALVGFWLFPLLVFAGVAGGIRVCAAIAERWRDGRPSGWLERQIAWYLRGWILKEAMPIHSGVWIPWRLNS